MQPLPFAIEANSPNPQVLIVHTHATETYQLTPDPWYSPDFTARTTDMSLNMTSVGAAMAAELNAAGINTVQDTTLHDYPSYTASYARSNETVRKYLQQYPSIKVVLDVHRDAIQKDDGTPRKTRYGNRRQKRGTGDVNLRRKQKRQFAQLQAKPALCLALAKRNGSAVSALRGHFYSIIAITIKI